jgi:membrane-associated protein
MDILRSALDAFLHLDTELGAVAAHYGALTHALLFFIVFCETGLVVAPFLPGDSLLFAAGALAAIGELNVWLLWAALCAAAVAGDAVNYWAGYMIGPRVFRSEHSRWLDRRHLERTRRFFDNYGNKTIIIARFVPIVRTIAPFVAGVGKMGYGRFAAYNVLGGVLWVTLFVFGGYFFGNLPGVRRNFGLVIAAIIVVSLLPAIREVVAAVRGRRPKSGVRT